MHRGNSLPKWERRAHGDTAQQIHPAFATARCGLRTGRMAVRAFGNELKVSQGHVWRLSETRFSDSDPHRSLGANGSWAPESLSRAGPQLMQAHTVSGLPPCEWCQSTDHAAKNSALVEKAMPAIVFRCHKYIYGQKSAKAKPLEAM